LPKNMNYFNYIVESKITKKGNIQINIPTFSSYEITKNTVELLLKQKNVDFDILIIDNASEDYKKLIKDFPGINYIVLKENAGGSGAQRIGAEIAMKYNYDYIIFTDNDAVLLVDDALGKMFSRFADDKISAVAPKNIDADNRETLDIIWKRQLPFHYIFVRISFLKRIELFNFYLFLFADDISLTSKIVSNGKMIICGNVFYYHETFKPKIFQNTSFYFYIRGFLLIIFFEKNISASLKIWHSFHLLYKILLCLLFSFQFRDVSYIKTIYLAVKNVINNYEVIDKKIPDNKYALREISPKNLDDVKYKAPTLLNSIFLKRHYKHYSNFNKRFVYFKLQKNKIY
jgi:GT2 family glycosyltransferase